MAVQGPVPINFHQAFPHGCFTVGEIERVKDFDASSKGRTVCADFRRSLDSPSGARSRNAPDLIFKKPPGGGAANR